MDNFVLFICGITITLISGMGVLVYMVSVGYKQNPNTDKELHNDNRTRGC